MTSLVDYQMSDRVQTIALERLKLHMATHVGGIAPMFERNLEVHLMREVDRHCEHFAMRLATSCIKGETTDEERTREFTHTFAVFTSWSDHLKFQIREGRVLGWLPRKWRSRLQVRYQNVTHKRTETFPVKVTKICPHATFDWDRDPVKHMQFLFPSRDFR